MNAKTFPKLSHYAIWLSNYPTSSISCERGFAFARNIDIPLRNRQSWDTFENELKLKLGKPLMMKLLEASCKRSANTFKLLDPFSSPNNNNNNNGDDDDKWL